MSANAGGIALNADRALRILRAGGVGGFDWDIPADEAVCSPLFYELYGFPPETPTRYAIWRERVHADDVEQFETALAAALSGGDRFEYEFRAHRFDTGEVRWLVVNGDIERDDAGRAVRMIGAHVDVTERKRAEAHQRETDSRYRTILEETTDFIVATDLDQRITVCNPAAASALGLAPDEIVGRSLLDFVRAEEFARTTARLRAKLEGGGSTQYELTVYDKDGRPHLWEINSSLSRDADGRPIGLHVLARDVSAARATQAALALSEDRLRLATKGAGIGLWDWDLVAMRGWWSPRTAEIMGVESGEDITLERRIERVHPDDRDRLQAQLNAMMNGGDEFSHDYRIVRPDGAVRWIASRGVVTRDADGRPVRTTGTVIDVTDDREAEARLRESEARLRRAQEAGGVGSYEWDIAGGLGRQSDSMLHIIGLTPGSAYSLKDVIDTVVDEDRPQVLATVKAIGDGAERAETDYRIRRADGEVRWIRDTGQLERDADGRPSRWVGIVQDVTARKTAELALAANEERLRLVQKAGAIGSFDWNCATGRVYRSPEYLVLHGLPPEAADSSYSDRWFDRVHPDDRARVEAMHRETVERPGDFANDHRIIRVSDGEIRWLSIRGTMLADEAGRPCRMLAAQTDITDRKRDEQRLRDSEARLRLVTDALPVLVSYVDRDQRYRFVNKGYETWFGRSRDEVLGQTMREVLGDVAYETLRPRIDAALAGQTVEFEATTPYRTGGTREIHANYIPQLADDGSITGFYVLVADVSERNAAESRLRASEERLRLMAAAAPQLLWVAGPDDANEWLNEKWNDYAGFDVVADPSRWRELVHPEDREAAISTWRAARDVGGPFEAEYRLRRHDGAYRWHLARALPFRDAEGNILRWFGTATDVQEHRRIAAELGESEARLRLAQDSGGIGLWDWNLATGATWWSDKLYEVVGLDPRSDRHVATFREMIHPDDQTAADAAAQAAIAGDGRLDIEFRVRRSDGRTIWLACRGEVVRGEDGEPQRVVGVNFDVTARKLAETALRELNDALQDRVDEAVAERELVLAQLHEAQKLETLGQLTGGVAHDFNNLLTPIVGSLDLLRRRLPDDPRAARLIDGALQAADRAQTLVARLLAFGRRQLLQARPVDVADLMHGLTDLIQRTIGQHIGVVVQPASDLPAARVDPNQLELAILNLAVNARDAMPGGGTLTITAHPETIGRVNEQRLAAGDYVRLSIIDTGTGMDADTLQRAIEPFFTTKGVGKGTGLGLSMIHGLAGQLGGALKLSSTVGIGTRVDLWLPVADAPPAALPATGELVEQRSPMSATVLLVDDEDLVRMGAAEMLGELGYAVVEAASGGEALRRVEAGERIDVVVTDYLMPGMNGGELIELIRRHHPAMPALIVSGYANVEGLPPGVRMLAKPFRHDDLAREVAAQIEAHKVVPFPRAEPAR